MILDQLARQHPKLRVIHQHNQGKSVAINHALKEFATGDLIMVLDADSYLTPTALTNMARRFDDPRLLGASANVRITRPHNLLEYVQKVEYLLGYRLKGSEELLGIVAVSAPLFASQRCWKSVAMTLIRSLKTSTLR